MHELNIPEVVAEVKAAFERYEAALLKNDLAVIDESFWASKHTLRYGVGELLYGIEAIRAYRSGTAMAARELRNTTVTTFGRDFAVANTEFYRANTTKVGRQTQTWIRMPEGWRVVTAHVSLIDPPSAKA